MQDIIRLCLDLNIWCANFLSLHLGRENTASQLLVRTVRDGHCALGSVQLVISWGMLNRLEQVIVQHLKADPETASTYIQSLAEYASLGPTGLHPSITLGGTGVIPIMDIEDGHVLETALAGDAHILATANLQDFISKKTRTIEANALYVHHQSNAELLIAHPQKAAEWIRIGQVPNIIRSTK